jgi:hypothetical protein
MICFIISASLGWVIAVVEFFAGGVGVCARLKEAMDETAKRTAAEFRRVRMEGFIARKR